MKKKELREQLIIVNDVVLKLHDDLTMVKLENQMLRKTLYSQEQEIRDLTTLLASMKDNARYLNRARYFKNAKIISPTFKEVYKTKGE